MLQWCSANILLMTRVRQRLVIATTLNSASLARQVYAVALYVEAERAAKELGVRKRGGFFDDNRRDPSARTTYI